MIEIYSNKDERCDNSCKTNCTDLVEVNDKINIALIINSIIIGLTAYLLLEIL